MTFAACEVTAENWGGQSPRISMARLRRSLQAVTSRPFWKATTTQESRPRAPERQIPPAEARYHRSPQYVARFHPSFASVPNNVPSWDGQTLVSISPRRL